MAILKYPKMAPALESGCISVIITFLSPYGPFGLSTNCCYETTFINIVLITVDNLQLLIYPVVPVFLIVWLGAGLIKLVN